MKFVLIWTILYVNGVGTGAAEFDDQQACEAAGARIKAFAQHMHSPDDPKADFICAPKTTGTS